MNKTLEIRFCPRGSVGNQAASREKEDRRLTLPIPRFTAKHKKALP